VLWLGPAGFPSTVLVISQSPARIRSSARSDTAAVNASALSASRVVVLIPIIGFLLWNWLRSSGTSKFRDEHANQVAHLRQALLRASRSKAVNVDDQNHGPFHKVDSGPAATAVGGDAGEACTAETIFGLSLAVLDAVGAVRLESGERTYFRHIHSFLAVRFPPHAATGIVGPFRGRANQRPRVVHRNHRTNRRGLPGKTHRRQKRDRK